MKKEKRHSHSQQGRTCFIRFVDKKKTETRKDRSDDQENKSVVEVQEEEATKKGSRTSV